MNYIDILAVLANLCLIAALLNPILIFFDPKNQFLHKISFITLSGAVLLLSYFYLSDSFVISNVLENSTKAQPIIYKICSLWANHQGSLLIFIYMISGWQIFVKKINLTLPKEHLVFFISSINSFFLFFLIFFANPFQQIGIKFDDGLGLNPLLQDNLLSIHPPILYLGYTSSILSLSLTMVALYIGKIDQTLFNKLKNCNAFTWSTLLLGISLGSWWAYKELGWGGVWFWDPVENISLLPFLSSTVLLHSLKTGRKHHIFDKLNLFFSILTFILCIHGFFLTRSDLISSVHNFAVEKTQSITLFIITSIIFVGSLGYFFYKQRTFKIINKNLNTSGKFILSEIICNIIILLIIYFTIIYPVFIKVFNNKILNIGENFFNLTLFIPVASMVILMIILDLKNRKFFTKKIIISIILSSMIVWLFQKPFISIGHLAQIIIGASLLLSMVSIIDIILYFIIKKRRNLNMLLAHLGFGIMLMGLVISKSLTQTYQLELLQNESNMNFELLNIVQQKNQNNLEIKANILFDNKSIFSPSVKFFPIEDQQIAEPFIKKKIFYDLHVVMTDFSSIDNKINITAEFKPLMNFIWLGVIIMLIGSLKIVFRLIKLL